MLNILSLNVNGIQDKTKRRAIFNEYRKRCNVLCLQECHSAEEDEKEWSLEWNGKTFFSHGSTSSRGVMICVNKELSSRVLMSWADKEGRIVSCDVNIDGSLIHVVNIYAPNKDSPTFFQNIFVQAHQCGDRIIVIGDYNTVLNRELDKKVNNLAASSSNNDKAAAYIVSSMNLYHMQEIW